jgi:1-phosphofructokinase family hexose kinase
MVITVTLNPTLDKIVEIPGFRVGLHARADLVGLLPNGKGNNVARGLARLGGEPTAYGFVGRYQEPLFIRSLESDGVRARFCPVDGETRTNTTILDPVARTNTHLREPGFRVSQADVNELSTHVVERLREAPEPVSVVFSGSLPPGMDGADLAELLQDCALDRANIVLDMNGPPLRTALDTGVVDTVAPNLEELGECFGTTVPRAEALETAIMLLARVKTVLLTLGAEGAYLLRREQTLGMRCPLQAGELRNTVGCGDAFLAGWLRGSELADDPSEELKWAVAAGAACAMNEMTVGYVLEDVEALLPRCEAIPAR